MSNVLFLAFWYPNKYNRQFCVYTQEHARAIHLAGNNLKVIAVHFKDSPKLYHCYIEVEQDTFGFETHHLYIESRFYKWIHINPWHCYLIVEHHFHDLMQHYQPDILHSNIVGVCAITGNWLAKKYHCRSIITEHWSRVNQYMQRNQLSFIGRKAYDQAEKITVVSEFLKKTVSNYVKNPGKIQIIPNVVDPITFAYRAKQQNENELVFCSIGHLKAPKLPLLMVEAMDLFAKQSNKKITFCLFGEGPLRKDIEERIPTLSYSLVLKGSRPKQEVAEALRQAHFCLHASSTETFCLAIAEALSTGTPVLASANGAIPELINKSNGVLARDEVDDWVRQLSVLVQTKWNHQQIATDIHEKYTYASIGKQFTQLYTTM